jgi:aldose 1-epimerase
MKTFFGRTPDGRETHVYTLQNARGFRADIADYGGTVVRLFAPDRRGNPADVALGFDGVADYAAHSPYFGCIVGRVGNRIAGGRFTLDGREYPLAQNNRPAGLPCCLHGGKRGFDRVVWHVDPAHSAPRTVLRLTHRSADGEEGFPGNLDVAVTYTATADNALRIDYSATTDRATPVNLTNHSYFNLAGAGAGEVLGHVVTLHASRYTPVNAGMIPTGQLAPVAGTPLDFTTPQPIGARIHEPHEQLNFGLGYDHNFVIDRAGRAADEPVLAATVCEPQSGRVLEVLTTEPGVQFYTGNFLDGSFVGKGGHIYGQRHGFCLETQHYPDSPNQPAFPSIILRPGATLHSTTVYRFSSK